MFAKIKAWFEMGVWTDARVRAAVSAGVISPQDYEAVTGRKYE